jgi:hypothetical protein
MVMQKYSAEGYIMIAVRTAISGVGWGSATISKSALSV